MPSLTLAETQGRLKDYLLDAANAPGPVLALVADGYGLGREQRLAIYHNAYRARLTEALETVYERTWAYLGDQEFYEMVGRYIEASPSAERNLRNYGSDFPAFLGHQLTDDPEVSELAEMDWKLHIAFDAPDAPRLTPAALGELSEADWVSAGFSFQPGLSLAVYAWNTLEIWHAIDQQQIPPVAHRLTQSVGHVFWRDGQKTNFRSLHPAEYRMLKSLLAGASFANSCDALRADFPETTELTGPWLFRWVNEGMIAGIILPATG